VGVTNPSRRSILGLVSLICGLASPAIVLIVLLGFCGSLVTSPRHVRETPDALVLVIGFGILLSPIPALVAIIAGHVARWRDKASREARAGLIIGYASLLTLAIFGLVGYLVWLTIP
jgi:hypothetical protein